VAGLALLNRSVGSAATRVIIAERLTSPEQMARSPCYLTGGNADDCEAPRILLIAPHEFINTVIR
jgi:hypothetical protein